MKRAIKAIAFTQVNDYFGESERSGDPRSESSLRDPRSEFHTVGKRLKVTTRNTQIVVG